MNIFLYQFSFVSSWLLHCDQLGVRFLFFLIKVQFIYKIMLVSGEQQSDSVFWQVIPHDRLLQGNGCNSLNDIVYSCCLPILYMVVV